MNGVKVPEGYPGNMRKDGFVITLRHKAGLISEELPKQILLQMDEEELKALQPETIFDQSIREEIKTRFNYCFPYQKAAGLKVKMTVSELKKLGQFVDEEQSEILFPGQVLPMVDTEYGRFPVVDTDVTLPVLISGNKDADVRNGISESQTVSPPAAHLLPEQEMTVPDFIRGTDKVTSGTDRGTLYHRVLELLDLSVVRTKKDLIAELKRMVKENKLTEDEAKKLKLDYIFGFTQSAVADRMRIAQEAGRLYKEQQFVMGVRADEVVKDQNGDELILIQGIIDVFFEENGELVLLDYKSDIVDNEEQLVNRYRVQLEYYKRALEQILKKKVKEMVIYSLYLGKEIRY
jgi:ATP-dependent helicase/nuclease subunit A